MELQGSKLVASSALATPVMPGPNGGGDSAIKFGGHWVTQDLGVLDTNWNQKFSGPTQGIYTTVYVLDSGSLGRPDNLHPYQLGSFL